jgi:hypothetical protein
MFTSLTGFNRKRVYAAFTAYHRSVVFLYFNKQSDSLITDILDQIEAISKTDDSLSFKIFTRLVGDMRRIVIMSPQEIFRQ